VRSELADRGILSYRLLWFEDADPSHWPRHSLGALGTHDLPTVAGLWRRTDPASEEMAEVRDRLARAAGIEPGPPTGAVTEDLATDDLATGDLATGDIAAGNIAAGIDAVIVAVHAALGRGASKVVVASLDDLQAVEERPNLPGTTVASNWATALPETIESLESAALAAAVVEALRATR
jgi:4-alpha-glucanotransferase